MQTRRFSKSIDFQVSVLGFGAMRLPVLGGDPAKIDEKTAVSMVREAIDSGVNFVDTAWPYHMGNSELVVGKALRDGYRNRVKLSTKSPTFIINAEGDFDRFLNTQLEKLGTDCIDFYLLHSLDSKLWENVIKRFDIISKAERAKKAGKIKHLGFSFHDEYDVFSEILDAYDKWEFVLLQYNYMNETYQQGLKGVRLAAQRGLGVIIMEPLLGGSLARPGPEIEAIFSSAKNKRTPTEWAFDYLWNMPEVSLVLSGMSTMDQVRESVEYANRSYVGMLDGDDNAVIDAVREKFRESIKVPCTRCGYCMPCPHGVDIPECFNLYNNYSMFNNLGHAKFGYSMLTGHSGESNAADACIRCGECEQACPQKIAIMDTLPKVHDLFK